MTFLRSSAAVLVLLAPCAIAADPRIPEPRILQLSERVYVLHGPLQHANPSNQGYMINATVIVGDKGVILVDSGGSHAVGLHLATYVRRITPKPVNYVVNTHHHGDHYLGNTAFAGATVISSETCRKLVAETGHEWLDLMERDVGHKLPGTKPRAADIAYPAKARTEMRIDGVRIVFWVPGGSHTAGDLVVSLPDEKIVIAGDVLVNGVVPTFQDGFVRSWIGTLDEMLTLGATRFVPGHGDVMTSEEVTGLRDAIARFYAGVAEGYRNGKTEAEIRATLDLSAWSKLERSYVIGRNLNRAYLEAEAASFDAPK
ncbi:MBL fold metallo-hydrolase [Usitatibacter rugosus]|uniref:MBL fold metallo-hydrolase n=1 Tax=Usitatibacter rugosus TaxID=2732067 RepID=UPI001BB0EA3A|nr:MBL fold metallo-hydrolase [Usitatibacter rugosus]